ncbi:unnamed protein product [Protopolystoma xenopodis]|uniref:Uncharacterized protein n=1 Tax=Protopolystoma xenopodis TaxID=117903 RepID=A0A448WZ54_9PLAT|nr:unnamed protein product [Protopolystoma xenopodis]
MTWIALTVFIMPTIFIASCHSLMVMAIWQASRLQTELNARSKHQTSGHVRISQEVSGGGLALSQEDACQTEIYYRKGESTAEHSVGDKSNDGTAVSYIAVDSSSSPSHVDSRAVCIMNLSGHNRCKDKVVNDKDYSGADRQKAYNVVDGVQTNNASGKGAIIRHLLESKGEKLGQAGSCIPRARVKTVKMTCVIVSGK